MDVHPLVLVLVPDHGFVYEGNNVNVVLLLTLDVAVVLVGYLMTCGQKVCKFSFIL